MNDSKYYFKNDLYLIIFYAILLFCSMLWQSHAPYDTDRREMLILQDLYICALFAFSSLLMSLIGLSELKSKNNEEAIYISKLVLGCIYGTLCTFIMVTIAETSILRHEEILQILITPILFYISIYFSILYYVKLKIIQYILIAFFANLPFMYLFTH